MRILCRGVEWMRTVSQGPEKTLAVGRKSFGHSPVIKPRLRGCLSEWCRARKARDGATGLVNVHGHSDRSANFSQVPRVGC